MLLLTIDDDRLELGARPFWRYSGIVVAREDRYDLTVTRKTMSLRIDERVTGFSAFIYDSKRAERAVACLRACGWLPAEDREEG